MVKTSLVSTEIERGSEILAMLDRAGLKLQVLLWASTDEHEDWRLVFASRKLDQLGIGEAYLRVHQVLESEGLTLRQTPTLMIFRTTDPFIKELRRTFGKSKDTEGMRLGGQLIGDRFIQDAYVYRIA